MALGGVLHREDVLPRFFPRFLAIADKLDLQLMCLMCVNTSAAIIQSTMTVWRAVARTGSPMDPPGICPEDPRNEAVDPCPHSGARDNSLSIVMCQVRTSDRLHPKKLEIGLVCKAKAEVYSWAKSS